MGESGIKYGSRVALHFTLRLVEDDHLVDTTRDESPMSFVVGEGELIPAMEERLLGLKEGDERKFEIPALEAYGSAGIDEDNLQNIPLSEFPAEMELAPGQIIGFTAPNGDEIPGTVMGFTDEVVTVNFAHPLAGHDLVFEVEIVDVQGPN